MNHNGHWQFNVLAGAATVCGDHFLLLRRSVREAFLPAVWGIPAGQLEKGEDPRAGCLRELYEETGLHGAIRDLIGYSFFSSSRSAVQLSNYQLNFLVRVSGRKVSLNLANHSEYEWLSFDDLSDERLDDFTRDIIKSAHDTLETDQATTRGMILDRGRR
jgi:8-oxo-dGTP diphosphatase